MEEVHGPDVEGRRDAHAGSQVVQAPGEVEPDLPVVEATVDVRRGDLDEARSPPDLGEPGHDPHRQRDTGGVWAMRVLSERVAHFSFADIAFPPLVWTLVASDGDTVPGLGPQISGALANASDWVHYGPDRTHVDLRSLTRSLVAIALPLLTSQDDWGELMTRDGTDAAAVVVFGRLP